MIFNRFNLKDSLYLRVTFNTLLNIKFIYRVKMFRFSLSYFKDLLNRYTFFSLKIKRFYDKSGLTLIFI